MPTTLLVVLTLLTLSLDACASHSQESQSSSSISSPLTLKVGGATLEVLYSDDIPDAQKDKLLSWVERSAKTVSQYYGAFPVKQAGVALIGTDETGVSTGRAMQGTQRPQILVWVGREVSASTLLADWVMIHEMIHLATASLNRKHRWFEEGLSVYLESVSRAQSGALLAEGVWREFFKRMPHGQLQGTDKGLSINTRWGRTYWGGAIFFLMADIRIRETSNNAFSLSDAVKKIVSAGLTMNTNADILTLIRLMDDALPSAEVSKLYRSYALEARPFPLKTIWEQLGVNPKDKTPFNDLAPLACIRKAITNQDATRC